MMIVWVGKNCSDGCPFYQINVTVDKKVRFHAPGCGLSGHKMDGEVLDIRPLMEGTEAEDVCRPGKNCPFQNVHGLGLEVFNHKE